MSGVLERAWYKSAKWLVLFRPLSLFYTAMVTRRRAQWLSGGRAVYQAPVPVVVVGNISVGGTGKTPVVLALIKLLRAQGYSPGVVSRGYGGRALAYPLRVTPSTPPDQSGDEPLLITSLSNVPLVVDPDRPRGVRALLEHAACDVVISDDGLQHYALGRDIEIAVVDAARGLANGRCLPEGPLREPPERLETVDFVLLNGELSSPAWHKAHHFILEPRYAVCLSDAQVLNLADALINLQSSQVHAVAGIGNPQRFFNTLKALGLDVIPHVFPDHHAFSAQDFEFGDDYPIIMTEKDAIKCKGFSLQNAWALGVEACFSEQFLKHFLSRLDSVQSEVKHNGS
ncbi:MULTISPECIES: tetraacyldisaccharide 4'-kinase [Nitrincola]|uniref:Tetraacyldisaccharide 4'-kinase n=1 Tax=Nitrincola nitratireducens TaxID=1229521 RepID=W9UVD9_9GAMM|nr:MULTISPECIES: tetraacyldisaccharide 4'-kinase [Nitrincola]EXJ11208.1 Tetraacyldisaccharide 4'-kinase [Nitrincola nitratireducens]